MRKIAKAIDSAPNASAESTSELVSANRPMPKNSARVQNTKIAMRTQDTGELRDLQRHQQSRLLDHAVVLVRRRQSLFLRVRLWLERREKVAHGLRVGQRRRDGEQIGVGLSASPECLIALDDSRLELVTRRLGLRPILSERLIEPKNLGGKALQFGLLGRVIGETDADQRSQNQRQEKGEQPRHLTDDAARLVRLVLIRQPLLHLQPGIAGLRGSIGK